MYSKYPEGAASSLGGTSSLRDQGEAPSHTSFDQVFIHDPSLVDWEVIKIIVTRMNHITVSIILNQCFGK